MTLREFFAQTPKAALAFSGGADSSYLLYAARECGAEVTPYYINTQFQPRFELEDARRLCRELGARLEVIELDVLADDAIASNPADRCYHCKRALFTALAERAAQDGYDLIIDGTNASDDAGDRPGMRALHELGVRSPLRECGISKARLRELSEQAGLFTAQKPAYACLATRVPTGERIDEDKLRRIELAEDALFAMGYTDFRARLRGEAALLQFPASQHARAQAELELIRQRLSGEFSEIRLDPKPR